MDLSTGIVEISSVGFCMNRDADGPQLWVFAGPLLAFHVLSPGVGADAVFPARTSDSPSGFHVPGPGNGAIIT